MRERWFVVTMATLGFVLGGFDALHALLGGTIGYLLEDPLGVATDTPKPVAGLKETLTSRVLKR